MKGAKISVKFASETSTWKDFKFKGYSATSSSNNKGASSEALVQGQPEPDHHLEPGDSLGKEQNLLQ